MKRILFFSLIFLLMLGGLFSRLAQAQSADTSPPEQPVKLIFIHHSTGENWLTDDYGNLGRELAANNYFVSDTNYGWGPDGIGDRTDIVNWREWFVGSESSRYMQALYNESGQNSYYTRTFGDPGGENQIVMFKSCFPNSALEGNPNDAPDPNEDFTVGHAKFVYNDLLNYFSTRPDKLFVVITAPPLQDPSYADNARAFNNWLVYDWLAENNYTYNNVVVFDFYNVLTHPDNHHRVNNGQIEHVSNGVNTLYYDSDGDDHPNEAGSQKATAEFIPLLNLYYHRWMAGAPAEAPVPIEQSAPTEEAQTPPEEEEVPSETEPQPPAESAPAATGGLIDDFEGAIPTGTDGWQAYWDESTSTNFACYLEDGSLRIDFDVAANSWATCTLFFDTNLDWSALQGLAFSYRADAPARIFEVTVHSGSLDESTSYQYTIESVPDSTGTWINMELAWSNFLGVDWEANAGNPVNPAQITGVAFGFGTFPDTPNTGTLWIDNLSLLGDEAEPAGDYTPDEAEAAEPDGQEVSVEEPQTEESDQQPETEQEAPTEEGGRGLCPNSIALGALVAIGSVWYRKKKAF